MNKLSREFYTRDPLTVAKELIGKKLVHNINGLSLSGRIVETEAYCGITDKACHSYGKKQTKRNEVMYKEGGIAYVYLIYGMYYCFNVVTEDSQSPSAVLIRAIEPLSELDEISKRRFATRYDSLTAKQRLNLTNGPGKLCTALSITVAQNGIDLNSSELYILDTEENNFNIAAGPRINTGYAQEFTDMPWRFFIKQN